MEQARQKISRIREYRDLVAGLKDHCKEKFTVDPIYRGALLYYLYLMADSCITLAEIVIRDKGLRPPRSYHEAFDILAEHDVLAPGFAFEFAKIGGFRNLLAHDYEPIESEVICGQVLTRLGDIDLYLEQIETALL